MREFLSTLKNIELFEGIGENEMEAMLSCINAKKQSFKAGEAIFLVGGKTDNIGIVLRGRASVVQEDFYGNRNIFTHVEEGELFGEAFACSETSPLPVSVFADEESDIMLIDFRRVMHRCTNACEFHNRLVFNMMRIVAQKNLLLNQKAELLSKRTTREKLLAYLSIQAKKAQSNEFLIPFNRQELADFLSVERSAMSAELCRMRDEGILDFKKNKFTMH